jgi:hypothetical protein
MFDQDLKDLWKRGAPAATLTLGEIERMLKPTTRRADRALLIITRTYLAMLAGAAALALVNLYGYRQNPTMLAVEAGIAVASIVLVGLTLRLQGRLRTIGRADVPLLQALEARLAFTERDYGPWLVMASATPWLFSQAIVTLIDNQDGVYRLNHPWEFAAVTAVMFGITYASLKFSTETTMREMRAMVQDLRAETLEATPGLAAARRRSRVWLLMGGILLALAVLAGLALWFKAI